MLIVLALSFWRLEVCSLRCLRSSKSSAFLFQALVVPFVRRYEKDLDLILLLIGSTALLFFHFLFELPWNALCSIVKRPYRSLAMRTPTRALAESTAVTPTAQSPRSRPTPRFRPAPHISSPTERRPIAVDLQDDLTAKQSPRPSLLVNAAKDAEPSRANAQGAAKVVKQGRVKSAVQVFDSASAEDHPRAAANGRSETPNPPPTRASSSRTDSTRQTRVARASDKAARSRPDPPGLPSEPQAKPRSASHSAKVRAALRTLPPAPSHEPRQTTTGPSLQRKRGSANTRPGSPSPSAAAKLAPRGQKRTRPDDDDEDYAESVTRPAPATSTKRATRMPRTKKTSDAGVTGARPKRPRAAATKSEDDAPRAKRTRTSTK